MAKQNISPTLQDAVDVFLLDYKARRLTASTIEYYKAYLATAFVSWCKEHSISHLHEVTANRIRTYLATVQDKGVAGYTVLNSARTVRAFLNFCVNEGWLTETPMKRVSMPKIDKPLPQAFSHNDIRAMLDSAASSRDTALILFLLDTGLRCSEAISLKAGDIDMHTGQVMVMGKGRKQRAVFLGARTRRALGRYWAEEGKPEATEPVFRSQTSNTGYFTRSGLFQVTRRIGKRAGIKPCTPHMFRRTFAITCLRNGMDIYSLQRLMGHEDLETLRHYLALAKADIEAAHDRHGPVDNFT